MRLLVETKGQFQLRVEDTGELIRHTGYTLVRPSAFISARVAIGQVEVIDRTNDEATDTEWQAYARECDGDLVVAAAAFVAAFPVGGAPAAPEAPAQKPAKPAKPARNAS